MLPSVILFPSDGFRERHIVHVTDPTIIVGIVVVPLLLVLCRQPALDWNTYKLFGSCAHCECSQQPYSCPVIELVNGIIITDFTTTC